MKKWKLLLSGAILAAGMGMSASASPEVVVPPASMEVRETGEDRILGKVVGDYILEMPLITKIDYEAGLLADKRDNSRYGCTAIAKTLDNGDTIVGRSMDLPYSQKPAVILRTAVPGFLKTVGIAYNPYRGETFEEVKTKGYTADELNALVFIATDIVNEKGFYIESNMRPGEPEELTGIKSSSGTNPGAEYSISFAALPRFLAERCATVDEAVALAQKINVTGLKMKDFEWGGAVLMADATGHSGVLEVGDNKLLWSDGARAQANFYLHPDYKDKAIFGSGYGRYELVTKGVGDVKSEADMLELMYKVRYSQMMTPETSEFDPLTEMTGPDIPELTKLGGRLTAKDAMAPENKEFLMKWMSDLYAEKRNYTLEELRNDGHEWQSGYQVVANCNRKSLLVRFFEERDPVYHFAVEE